MQNTQSFCMQLVIYCNIGLVDCIEVYITLTAKSNFSFSHSVFKRLVSQGRQKMSLCGNGLTAQCRLLMATGKMPMENIVGKGDNAGIDPLPHMPILGSSNSAANKDMMSEILIKGNTIF